jgi:drug/metabolite transporter (DMT)-like permease
MLRGELEEELKTSKQTSQKEVVNRKGLILLGIMGIIGLIFFAFGVFLIFEKSPLLGLILLVLGVFIYCIFILVERKLKLL